MSAAILPARADVARQPQAAAEPDDVRVERHDQLRAGGRASTRRGPPRRAAPSSAGTGSAACRRCQPTAAERSSTRRDALGHAAVGAPDVERQRARRETVERGRRCPAPPDRQPSQEEPFDRARAIEHLPQDQSSATMSTPRVQRWTIARSSGRRRLGSKLRTKAAGPRPDDARSSVSIELQHARHAPERQRRRAERRRSHDRAGSVKGRTL